MHYKKKNRKTASISAPSSDSPSTDGPIFHPSILFCGECSSCSEPPPSINNISLTTVDEEISQIDLDLNDPDSARFVFLRVYNVSIGATGRVNVLRTILEELPHVRNLELSESHHSPSVEYKEFSNNPTGDRKDEVDPTSCMIMIEYDAHNFLSNAMARHHEPNYTIKVDLQENRDDNSSCENDATQSILSRLTDAGFDFALLSSRGNKTRSLNRMIDNSTNQANSEPPPSCRTRLHVSGICCSSEIPTVRSIIRPLPGVLKVGVNVATKVVFVDHDPGVISARMLMEALNKERFNANILKDGSLDMNCIASSSTTVADFSQSKDAVHILPSKYVESTFLIPGLLTSHRGTKYAVNLIEKLIRQNFFKDQVRTFHTHAPSRTVKVEHDATLITAEKIKGVLKRGLSVDEWGCIDLLHDGGVEKLALPMTSQEHDNNASGEFNGEEDRIFHGLKHNVVISGIFWVVSLLSEVHEVLSSLEYAGLIAVLFGMPPVVMKAWITIRRFQFDANCMMVVAAFGALALGEFEEAASVSFLFAISEWLEIKATSKARCALGEIMSLRPEYAHLVDEKSGEILIIPASQVPLGSSCWVRTGDKVPADGVVIEGTSALDESSITGEARPVDKVAGERVSAGSINVGATQLLIKTSSTVEDSTLSRLIMLVEEAQTNRSETEKLVDSFAKKYTPFVLSAALMMCTIPWIFGPETGRQWTLNGLIIVVIACPCALTISTPVTYSAGLAATAKRGVVIKGGSKLEALGNIRTVMFDKTGTLTQGRFALNHFELIGALKSRSDVLELLSIMEAPSSHPLSATLVSAAKAEGITPKRGASIKNHTILKGEGVCANVNGQNVFVGNERLFSRLGMLKLSPHHLESTQKWNKDGGTVGYIGIQEEGLGIVGMFCVTDTIREESPQVVASLLQSGVDVIMLTGDGEGAAQAIGRQVGIAPSHIHSRLLPEEKLHFVSVFKDSPLKARTSILRGRELVMMVGDGVNDAPSLAVADVGVAMGQGAALALEMSDVTLMDSNLNKLLFSMSMGAKVIVTVKENIIFSFLANAIAVAFTFLGKMTLLAAIACDVGVMLLVTLNGMKLLSERVVDAIDDSIQISLQTKPKSVKMFTRNNGQYEVQSIEDVELEII